MSFYQIVKSTILTVDPLNKDFKHMTQFAISYLHPTSYVYLDRGVTKRERFVKGF